MNYLSEKELRDVKGGFGFWSAIGIVTVVVFAVGVLDGIAHPFSCN